MLLYSMYVRTVPSRAVVVPYLDFALHVVCSLRWGAGADRFRSRSTTVVQAVRSRATAAARCSSAVGACAVLGCLATEGGQRLIHALHRLCCAVLCWGLERDP